MSLKCPTYITMAILLLSVLCNKNDAYSSRKFHIKQHRNIYLTPENKKIEAVIDTRKRHKENFTKTYFWFDNSCIHSTVGGFSGYVLDGHYAEFSFPGNELILKGYFKNGVKSGSWSKWFTNNQIHEKSHYKNGELNGKVFNLKGSLLSVQKYKHGELNGKQTTFIGDTVEKTTFYKKGEIKTRRHYPFHSHSKNEQRADSNNKKTVLRADIGSKMSGDKSKTSASQQGAHRVEDKKTTIGKLWLKIKNVF